MANRTVDLIKKYDFTIQKKYGQNFLMDDNILRGIVDAAGVTKDDIVLEIGPGMGALTSYLCEAAGIVIAVEIDRMLIPILKETMAGYKNFVLVNEDILKVDIDRLVSSSVNEYMNKLHENRAEHQSENCTVLNVPYDEIGKYDSRKKNSMTNNVPYDEMEKCDSKEKNSGVNEDSYDFATKGSCICSDDWLNKKIKVVANLPYYITTPIIMDLLEKQDNIASITVMIQKEVAERMQEGPGSKAYGALSLAVQYYSRPKLAMIVSKNCFLPKPDVDSAVINLEIYDKDERLVKADDPKKMFDIIRAAFNQRRKTMVNALSNAQNLNYTKENILKAISEIGKPDTIRGEALTLEEFARLSNVIK